MITSARNPQVRALHRLRLAANRDRTGFVLVEGAAALTSVLAAGATIDRLLVAPRAVAHGELVRAAVAAGARRIDVSPAVMSAVCNDVTSPPALVASVRRPTTGTARGDRWLWLLLTDVRDPGSLGAILQAAAATGVSLVATTRGCADPWDRKAVRASAGAGWFTAVRHRVEPDSLVAEAREAGGQVVALGPDGEAAHTAGWPAGSLLVTGEPGARLGADMRIARARGPVPLADSVAVPAALFAWRDAPR